jgi:4-diphosphocytidyl-2-C-methyl-D-erythritol kinase
MLAFPNCKINLGLYITKRRDDGYHDLETVFYPLKLRESLEIVPSKKASLHVTGLPVMGKPENNLVWKAYELMKTKFPGKIPPFNIYLHKVIPMGAGLGGGSANGAFMLQLLNDYCALGQNKEQLSELALQLGSDCPFFIHNTPHFAEGRGEKMSPVEVDLSNYSIQLICPEIHISTTKAFKAIVPDPAPFDLRNLHKLPVEEWREFISNDFEEPVFKQYPELSIIKSELYEQGALYASMSGSGSAIFGIFPDSKKADLKSDADHEDIYMHEGEAIKRKKRKKIADSEMAGMV